ncbi:ADP-ribosylglycohydrolase family protein [Kribbella shirazensis]|uniref:ADP-ribosylglycohydrolase n=1 Tax=Kribbella shirazensis TaxID=1105143 RepID=A0A7X5VCM4_9ACTN|nr:ADP-ribosylglycohydrolase family protein [Kribbella shirazensis]NIK58336.1 ADP-ribosylglycohydrolase [Kribbella shirazensis]
MPEATSTGLEDKAVGVLVGSAVGDAIGGAVEGWTPEAIRERHGGWVTGIVGPWYDDWRTARPIAPYHKGDGHITDDTLMTHALVEVYDERRTHLDAYAVAESLVPKMIDGTRWVPELEADALLLQRVFLAEKWLVARLHYGHVDPREAGVGNIVNCGAAMYMAPVGIANAGDPEGAYAEALDVAGAHQSSYGREAAGVFAAAVAAAMVPGATAGSAVEAALKLAKDGTRRAVEAVAEAAAGLTDWEEAIPVLRQAIEPYDTVGPNYRELSMDARRPSRTKAIEELPVALGFVLVSEGDVRRAVLGGTNYGRDADSIASMAGAITGALQGHGGVPADWAGDIAEASKTDLVQPGRVMASVVQDIRAADAERWARRAAALDALV